MINSFAKILGEKLLPKTNKETRIWLMEIASIYDWNQMIFGPNPKSALWHDKNSQIKRFKTLIEIFDKQDQKNKSTTINDFGCGYGAFFEFIKKRKEMKNGIYYGYDISRKMIDEACKTHKNSNAKFYFSDKISKKCDYSFASGTFGFKPDIEYEKWNEFVKSQILHMAKMSKKGIAFNMLNSNAKDQKDGLFYSSPSEYKDFCEKNISPNIQIKEGYIEDDWTMFIKY